MRQHEYRYVWALLSLLVGMTLAFTALAQKPQGKGGKKAKGALQDKKGSQRHKSTEGKAGQPHGKAGEHHGKAGQPHGKAGEHHGKAGQPHGKASEHHGKAGEHHGKPSSSTGIAPTPHSPVKGRGKCHLKKEWHKHTKRMAKLNRIASLAETAGKADLKATTNRIRAKEMHRHRRVMARCMGTRPFPMKRKFPHKEKQNEMKKTVSEKKEKPRKEGK